MSHSISAPDSTTRPATRTNGLLLDFEDRPRVRPAQHHPPIEPPASPPLANNEQCAVIAAHLFNTH